MNPELTLEIGRDEKASVCHCCGLSSSTGHGFVYRNGAPYGVYFAGWAEHHKEQGVTFAIAIGEWEEGSTAEHRICVGLEAFEGATEIFFGFIEPESSPWPETELLGRMLSRAEALTHSLHAEFLAIGELAVRAHPAIQRFLCA